MKQLFLIAAFVLALTGAANAQSVTFNITWVDNSSGQAQEDGTKIEQKINAGVYAEIAQVLADVTTYNTTVANPFPGQHTLCYRLKAFNVVGESPYSGETCVVTPVVPRVAPLAPGKPAVKPIP